MLVHHCRCVQARRSADRAKKASKEEAWRGELNKVGFGMKLPSNPTPFHVDICFGSQHARCALVCAGEAQGSLQRRGPGGKAQGFGSGRGWPQGQENAQGSTRLKRLQKVMDLHGTRNGACKIVEMLLTPQLPITLQL